MRCKGDVRTQLLTCPYKFSGSNAPQNRTATDSCDGDMTPKRIAIYASLAAERRLEEAYVTKDWLGNCSVHSNVMSNACNRPNRELVLDHIDAVEQRFSRIIACRVGSSGRRGVQNSKVETYDACTAGYLGIFACDADDA